MARSRSTSPARWSAKGSREPGKVTLWNFLIGENRATAHASSVCGRLGQGSQVTPRYAAAF
jgi:hypothetical protein